MCVRWEVHVCKVGGACMWVHVCRCACVHVYVGA